jgi:glycerol uptake facilitator-like aquaporin
MAAWARARSAEPTVMALMLARGPRPGEGVSHLPVIAPIAGGIIGAQAYDLFYPG